MRFYYWVCLVVILAACSSTVPTAPLADPAPTVTPRIGTPVASPVSTDTKTPEPTTARPQQVPSTQGDPTSVTPTRTQIVPEFEICSPLTGYVFSEFPDILSQGFSPPQEGKDNGHHGIDLSHFKYKDRDGIAGVAIQAVFTGVVAASIDDSWPYGNFVIIETPLPLPGDVSGIFALSDGDHSLYHLYAHMADPPILVQGESINCGDLIGHVGSSGWSGNPHLHFEFRIGPPGISYDAMRYYLTTTTEEERANYEEWRIGDDFHLVDPMNSIQVWVAEQLESGE